MRQQKCESMAEALEVAADFLKDGEEYVAIVKSFDGRIYVENEPPLLRAGEELAREIHRGQLGDAPINPESLT